ncbi:hypothetical protein L484_001521 [Morus notabilis]|uniref:Uncharacterized protein n=1 Tax=Morus notabilis TaxID=981085 RepID=W9QZN1_9ROSA|nr:hypothetical protein L484_001521 [Morus notabilis]
MKDLIRPGWSKQGLEIRKRQSREERKAWKKRQLEKEKMEKFLPFFFHHRWWGQVGGFETEELGQDGQERESERDDEREKGFH